MLRTFLVRGLFFAALGSDDALLRCRFSWFLFAHAAFPPSVFVFRVFLQVFLELIRSQAAAARDGSALLGEKFGQRRNRGRMRAQPALPIRQVMVGLRHSLQTFARFAVLFAVRHLAELIRSAAKICGVGHGHLL
jgi:hypothetical protein